MEVESPNCKIETAFNRLELRRLGRRIELRGDDNTLQSVIDLDHPHRLCLKNLEHMMAVQLFIPAPRRILLLGIAAGSLLHYLRHFHPQAHVTAVDIDDELVEQMLEMRLLPQADASLSYVYDDAGHYIADCTEQYDLLLIDLFTGSRSPSWLLERQKMEHLHRLLGDNGALAYNLLIDSEHDFKRFYRDLRLVFAQKTLCLPVEGFENTIAYGIRAPLQDRDMSDYLQQAVEQSERLGIDLVQILSVIYNTNPVGAGVL